MNREGTTKNSLSLTARGDTRVGSILWRRNNQCQHRNVYLREEVKRKYCAGRTIQNKDEENGCIIVVCEPRVRNMYGSLFVRMT